MQTWTLRLALDSTSLARAMAADSAQSPGPTTQRQTNTNTFPTHESGMVSTGESLHQIWIINPPLPLVSVPDGLVYPPDGVGIIFR